MYTNIWGAGESMRIRLGPCTDLPETVLSWCKVPCLLEAHPATETCSLISQTEPYVQRALHLVGYSAVTILKFLTISSFNLCCLSKVLWDNGACTWAEETHAVCIPVLFWLPQPNAALVDPPPNTESSGSMVCRSSQRPKMTSEELCHESYWLPQSIKG